MTPDATADRITETVLAHLREEVRCTLLSEEDGRIGCMTPLEYPDRDNVVVWVRQEDDKFLVTDYGDALADSLTWRKKERRELDAIVADSCRAFGVEYADGRLFAHGRMEELGELVWRLASAAAQVAHAMSLLRPAPAKREETAFSQRVKLDLKRTFAERKVDLQIDRELTGQSGHPHRATIFIPATESVIEPVTGNWNQVNATYTKFGDLQHANGFHLYSLLDDQQTEKDVSDLLAQVSAVVEWSRRDEWLTTVS